MRRILLIKSRILFLFILPFVLNKRHIIALVQSRTIKRKIGWIKSSRIPNSIQPIYSIIKTLTSAGSRPKDFNLNSCTLILRSLHYKRNTISQCASHKRNKNKTYIQSVLWLLVITISVDS